MQLQRLMPLVLVVTTACVTVALEERELAGALTERIQATRAAHVQLVRLYMDEKRREVDRFVTTEWVPRFATNLFQEPAVQAAWDHAADGTRAARVDFLVHVGPLLQEQINEKRQQLIAPLDEAERAITRRLNENYDEMLAMNTTLTGLLAAAAKNTDTRQQIMQRLDASDRLPAYLGTVEQMTQLLVDRTNEYEQKKPRIDSLLAKLKARL